MLSTTAEREYAASLPECVTPVVDGFTSHRQTNGTHPIQHLNGHKKPFYAIIAMQHTHSMGYVLTILCDYQQQTERPIAFETLSLDG
jgi:hypothetical protein